MVITMAKLAMAHASTHDARSCLGQFTIYGNTHRKYLTLVHRLSRDFRQYAGVESGPHKRF